MQNVPEEVLDDGDLPHKSMLPAVTSRITSLQKVDTISIVENKSARLLAARLEAHLGFARESLLPHQAQTFEKLVVFLRDFAEGKRTGRLTGLIKHPTGAGKTRLFAEIASALDAKTLVLVPRLSLIEQTVDTMLEVGFLPHEVASLELKSGDSAFSLWKQKIQQGHTVMIMSYPALLSIWRTDREALREYMHGLDYLVSDEGHRALGKKTKDMTLSLLDNSDDEESREEVVEYQAEVETERLLEQEIGSKLHLFFTATPDLSSKNVQEEYNLPMIDSLRVQEMVEEGVLVMPRRLSVGTATAVTDQSSVTDRVLTDLADAERFRMEDGRQVGDAVLDMYQELLQEHGFLPGVVFCSTIQQAEHWKLEAESRGLRVARSTSANNDFDSGISTAEAKNRFEDQSLDLLFTVSKVGEGWDVKRLQFAAWLNPVRSPAKYLQGIGRVMRSFQTETFKKTHENTFVVEPDWYVKSVPSFDLPDPDDEKRTGGPFGKLILDDKKLLFKSLNMYDWLAKSGEVNSAYLAEEYNYEAALEFRTSEEWKAYFRESMSPEEWMTMTWDEINILLAAKHGISTNGLARKLGLPGTFYTTNQLERIILGRAIWPESSLWDQAQQVLERTAEGWRSYFRDVMTPEEWVAMKKGDIVEVFGKKHGIGIVMLARKFNISGNPMNNQRVRLALGHAIWPESPLFVEEPKKPERTVAEWIAYFHEAMTPEEWAAMTFEDSGTPFTKKHEIPIGALARKLGISGNPRNHRADRLALGHAVWPENPLFVEEPKKPERTAEEWITYFKLAMTPEEWAAMSSDDAGVPFTKKHDIGMSALKSVLGSKGNPVGNASDRLALGRAIWPESPLFVIEPKKPERTVEEWIAYFHEAMTPEEWDAMTYKQLADVFRSKHGISITKLARKFRILGNPEGVRNVRIAMGHYIWSDSSLFIES